MKNQLRIFLTAVQFYTRIPVPGWVGFSKGNLNRATAYFPLIGIIVGAFGGVVFWGADKILPGTVSVLLAMIATILLTGAFHEDAISDFCDGFGGGYSREQILNIMKDSRIGTYGAIGLVMVLLSRFVLLSNIDSVDLFIAMLAGNALSRLTAVGLIFSSNYVGAAENSKSKPVGERHNALTFLLALAFGLLPLFFIPLKALLITVPALLLTLVFFRSYILKILGGYTGDVLGALQQISELVFYLCFLVHYIM